jgi:hypothetical protein
MKQAEQAWERSPGPDQRQVGLFLCMTIPRRWPAHVRRLNDALNDPPGDMARSRALMDYVIEARGIETLRSAHEGARP